MEGLGSEQSGGGNAEVRALRAQVREQSLRIAQLEEQLEKAQAFADVKSLIQALNRRVQSTLRWVCRMCIFSNDCTLHLESQALGGRALCGAPGVGRCSCFDRALFRRVQAPRPLLVEFR